MNNRYDKEEHLMDELEREHREAFSREATARINRVLKRIAKNNQTSKVKVVT